MSERVVGCRMKTPKGAGKKKPMGKIDTYVCVEEKNTLTNTSDRYWCILIVKLSALVCTGWRMLTLMEVRVNAGSSIHVQLCEYSVNIPYGVANPDTCTLADP